MTKATRTTYRVVENAGYEREYVTPGHFADYRSAQFWMNHHYEDDEVESLHVDIAKQLPDGSLTYDF